MSGHLSFFFLMVGLILVSVSVSNRQFFYVFKDVPSSTSRVQLWYLCAISCGGELTLNGQFSKK